jgi:heme-degrading monooxygenase HmoA
MKYVFLVRVIPPYTVAEYAAAWAEASRIIQETPGALGTELHRCIGRDDTLLAIAHWSSKAARDAKDDDRHARVRAILDLHARTCEITPLGEFEEPEWVVQPPAGRG